MSTLGVVGRDGQILGRHADVGALLEHEPACRERSRTVVGLSGHIGDGNERGCGGSRDDTHV
jgi:hypothetical protein